MVEVGIFGAVPCLDFANSSFNASRSLRISLSIHPIKWNATKYAMKTPKNAPDSQVALSHSMFDPTSSLKSLRPIGPKGNESCQPPNHRDFTDFPACVIQGEQRDGIVKRLPSVRTGLSLLSIPGESKCKFSAGAILTGKKTVRNRMT